jgi:hypothetical protein
MQSNTAANDGLKRLLDQVNFLEDTRDFTIPKLQQLTCELREASIVVLPKPVASWERHLALLNLQLLKLTSIEYGDDFDSIVEELGKAQGIKKNPGIASPK